MDYLNVRFYWSGKECDGVLLDILKAVYNREETDPITPLEKVTEITEWAENDTRAQFQYGTVLATLLLKDRPFKEEPNLPKIGLFLDQHFLEGTDTPGMTDEQQDFLTLVKFIYTTIDTLGQQPRYVLGATEGQTAWLRGEFGGLETSTQGVRNGQLEELCWLQILPSAMVETVGRERVLTAPAWHVEELPDDSVLIVVGNRPGEDYERYVETREHLGLPPIE